MLRLAEMYLKDDLPDRLMEKWKQYQKNHPDDRISLNEFSEIVLEFGIRFLDVTALD